MTPLNLTISASFVPVDRDPSTQLVTFDRVCELAEENKRLKIELKEQLKRREEVDTLYQKEIRVLQKSFEELQMEVWNLRRPKLQSERIPAKAAELVREYAKLIRERQDQEWLIL